MVADLRTLRTLAELLLRLDAVTFLGYLESLRASEAVGSVWLFHDAAHTIFEQAKRRVWAMGGGAAASKRKRAGAGGEAVRRGPGAGGALPGICSLTQTLTRCVCQLACTPRSAPRDRSVVDGEGQRLGARRSPWSAEQFLRLHGCARQSPSSTLFVACPPTLTCTAPSWGLASAARPATGGLHAWCSSLKPTHACPRTVPGQGAGGAAGGGAGSVVPVLEEMPKWAVLRTLLEARRLGPTQG